MALFIGKLSKDVDRKQLEQLLLQKGEGTNEAKRTRMEQQGEQQSGTAAQRTLTVPRSRCPPCQAL